MKLFYSCLCLMCSLFSFGQLQVDFDEQAIQEDFVTNFDIYSEAYTDPILDVYSYNQLAGWETSANLLKSWEVRLQFVASVSVVPDENLMFNFNDQPFTDNIELKDPSDPLLPTVLGGSTDQVFIYTVQDRNGNSYEEEIPVFEGIDAPFNAVPDIVPQVSLGLPAGFEVNARYFPKIELSGVDHQHWGLGLRHQISKYFWEGTRFNWSVGGSFSQNSYVYLPDQFLEGEDQEIRLRSDAFNLNTLIGYDLDFVNFFGGISWFSWQNNFDILGTYRYEVEVQTGPAGLFEVREAFSVEDPVSVTKENTGLRFTAGASFTFFKYLGVTFAYTANPRQTIIGSLNFNFVD